MTEHGTFLRVPYGGYWHRHVPEEDAELTHVGPGTPGGELLRHYWQPIAFSHEVKDLPIRLRILGEDLVLFRDRGGRVGVLELHCPHRGTSLEFGLPSERGIRCCYHGWLFDVDGRILETPGEPADSTLTDRLCHGAYPVREYQGLVFTYMGPPDRQPSFPRLDTFELPHYRVVPGLKQVMPCNWLQIKDNSLDAVHTAFLHTRVSGQQFTAAYGVVPLLEWRETPIGAMYIGSRRVGEHVWVRICEFIVPNVHQFPPNTQDATHETPYVPPYGTHWAVPIDDTHTLNIDVRHVPETMSAEEEQRLLDMSNFGQSADRPYEERQRVPGDYDAQVSQRPLAIHALEHLASTDRGVIIGRKLLRQAVAAVARGDNPVGVEHPADEVVRTYSQDCVLRVARSKTDVAERELLLQIGRDVADGKYRPA
jgi:nitrite reductase/ring-hydroxylating ferredoxin subunit